MNNLNSDHTHAHTHTLVSFFFTYCHTLTVMFAEVNYHSTTRIPAGTDSV